MSQDDSGFANVKDSKKSLLPALIAVGGGLAAAPVAAIELGDVNVESTIGEPLRASIAYALGPNEELASYCVSLLSGTGANGLPSLSAATVSVAGGVISLTGTSALREPLMSLRVNLACPYAPKLTREYLLFVDPPAYVNGTRYVDTAPATADTPVPQPMAATTDALVARQPATPAVTTPIDPSQRYRVQAGDSLSEIVQRIEGRDVGLWSAVAQIFDANPDAFIDNDPNRLKAGSLLTIPAFQTGGEFAALPRATDAAASEPAVTGIADPVVTESTLAEMVPDTVADEPEASVYPGIPADTAVIDETVDDTTMLEPASPPAMADLQPGDVILDADIAVPPVTAESPNVPVASIIQREEPSASSNWFLWLIGAGVAMIAGLFMFGRRRSDAPAPLPEAPEHPMRRASDTGEVPVIEELDYDIDDDSPTQENLTLDADLEIGTGLSDGTNVDINQDFGFAVTTQLDMELPDERAIDVDDVVPETDIISPPGIDESSILESEMLPEDDDYDMSVIVDATKVPRPEEVTERDLKAVVVNKDDDTLITDDYTVSQERDYDILEQDYQDELTATQALNQEIEKAAAVLAERMEDADEATAEMPLATVTELDVTANLPASNDSVEDDEPTDINKTINEEALADDNTVEMPKSDKAG